MPSSSSFQVAIQVFGYLATCCFALLLVPQIILNQTRQSTDGLSLSLVILWHLAALFYLPYLLFLKEPLPLLLQWILFTVASVIIELQFLAFQVQDGKKAAGEKETQPEGREEEVVTAAAATSSSSESQESDGKGNGGEGKEKRKKHLLLLALAVGSTIVSLLFIVGLLYLFRALEPRKDGDDIIKILGSGLSSVFLAAGFLPQLYLMCKSRSSEGLSLGLSALDFCGSFFSIIVLCLEAKMDKVAVDVGGVIPYTVIVGFQVVMCVYVCKCW